MKMSEQEYKELQDNLSAKLSDDNLSRVTTVGWSHLLGWREKEAYKAGILAAKSIVASFYYQHTEEMEK